MGSGDLEMDPRLKKTIVGASLFAFGTHTFDLAHEGIIGHEMPSALQMAASGVAATTSTATVSIAFCGSVGSASTAPVYPHAADSEVPKHTAQTVPPPPHAAPAR